MQPGDGRRKCELARTSGTDPEPAVASALRDPVSRRCRRTTHDRTHANWGWRRARTRHLLIADERLWKCTVDPRRQPREEHGRVVGERVREHLPRLSPVEAGEHPGGRAAAAAPRPVSFLRGRGRLACRPVTQSGVCAPWVGDMEDSNTVIVNRSMEALDRGRLPAARCDSNVTLSNDRQTSEGEPFSRSVETVASVSLSASRDTQSVSADDTRASLFVHRGSFSNHFVARPSFDASSSRTTVAVALHDAAGHDSDDSVWFQRVADNHPEVAFSSLRFDICTAIATNCHEKTSRWPIPSSRTPLRRPRTLPTAALSCSGCPRTSYPVTPCEVRRRPTVVACSEATSPRRPRTSRTR
jgi:hypothetical protein